MVDAGAERLCGNPE